MPTGPRTTRPARKKRIDWDGAWKEAIQQLLPAFLELLFPDVYALIDWTQEPVFLEQELRQVTRRVKRGKGAVDKLVRVRLKDGRQANLLIHIEFQNQVDPDLPDRLYTYNTRIYSLLHEHVISLAVLGDRDPLWRLAEFGYAYASFETRMRFPVAKLLDYEAKWSTLEESANPFAVIVMAHLKTLATMRQPESRLEWKLRLARALYDRAYSEAQIQQLLNFIDWLMVLDDRREARFDETVRHYEEERTMPTVTRFEARMEKRVTERVEKEVTERVEKEVAARVEKEVTERVEKEVTERVKKEVAERGLLQGRREAVLENLAIRFDPIPEDIVAAVQQTTDQVLLKKLLRGAVQVATLEEFRGLMPLPFR